MTTRELGACENCPHIQRLLSREQAVQTSIQQQTEFALSPFAEQLTEMMLADDDIRLAISAEKPEIDVNDIDAVTSLLRKNTGEVLSSFEDRTTEDITSKINLLTDTCDGPFKFKAPKANIGYMVLLCTSHLLPRDVEDRNDHVVIVRTRLKPTDS